MGESKGNIIATVLGLLLLLGGIAAGLYFGGKTVFTKSKAIDLTEIDKLEEAKGQWVSGEVVACTTEFYEVKHNMNGIIPTGKEHYFATFMSDDGIYVIRASKSWYEKYFDADTFLPKSGSKVELTGYVRKIDSKFTKEIQQQIAMTTAKEKPVYYIDTLAMRYGIFLLILAIFPVFLVILFFVLRKTGLLDAQMDSGAGKVFVVLMIVGILGYGALLLHTLAMV
ncbi:MAG: hypothetical protein J5738_04405 [Lachnospiraceae bacterium]|nr:hypothetical protein [Lachnospiraceae bacterium]